MLSINIEVPDSLLLKWDGSKDTIRKNIQKILAVRLFETDVLTTGQAAEMCGMNRVDFITDLSRMGVPVVKMDAEELEDEIKNAMKL